MIVIDVSVFVKLFLPEEDQDQAHRLFEHAVTNALPLVAPTILFYEAASVALRYGVAFDLIFELIERLVAGGLRLVHPNPEDMRRTHAIATAGHAKSGYPELADSIYHAMAIERRGIFVTADQRHVAKTKQFGSVVLLADWRPE
jgi:predicted nucleic acid-binding protein